MWMVVFVFFGLYIWFATSYSHLAAIIALNVLNLLYEAGKRLSEGDTCKPPDDPDQLGYFKRLNRDDQ
jgi:hypothetical protein